MIRKSRHFRLSYKLVLFALLLAACAGPAQRLWTRAPGWSRGMLLGNTQPGDPVPMAMDDEGRTYLFLLPPAGEGALPHLLCVNADASICWDQTFQVPIHRPDQPRLFWRDGRLSLYWSSRGDLYTWQVSAQGEPEGDPRQIPTEIEVDSYDVAFDTRGEPVIFYAGSRRKPGLYALQAGRSLLLDPQGVRPRLLMDSGGTLHAAWAQYPTGYGASRFLYAAYEAGQVEHGVQVTLLATRFNPSVVMKGPGLGLDGQRGYLFWTVEVRAGLEAGVVTTSALIFPLSDPASTRLMEALAVPSAYNLEYRSVEAAALRAGERLPVETWPPNLTTHISDAAPVGAVQGEFALAFRARVDYLLRKDVYQIGLLYFREGEVRDYQLVSFTTRDSVVPSLRSDSQGNLHLTWLEKGELPGFLVYYATTSPDAVRALARLTLDDGLRLAGETLFGMVSGALLFPMALAWMVIPLLLMGVLHFLLRGRFGETWIGQALMLGLPLIAYWVAKLAFFPDIFYYVPFSAWIPIIPRTLEAPLRLGVPLLIAALAAYLAYRVIHGRERQAALYLFLIYAAVDGLLTMALYGVVVLGGA